MKPPINTFIFDCFRVVCEPALGGWYRDYCTKHNFTDEHLPEVLRQHDLGLLSENDIFDYFSRYPGITSTREQIRDETDSYLKLNEDLVVILKELKRQGFKVALLSNANNAFFERKLYPQYPEFKSLFSEIVVSSVVGMVKPEPDIYLHTLNLVKSKPEESLFIDDSASNVAGAQALGIHGFVYTDCPTFVNHLSALHIDLNS